MAGVSTLTCLRLEEIHGVPETNKRCPHCGLTYDLFPPGEETSEEIGWRVRIERKVHRRLSYHKTCQRPGVPAITTAASNTASSY